MGFSAPKQPGFQQHHLIPQDTFQNHEIFKKLAAIGGSFDIDDVAHNMLNLAERASDSAALSGAQAAELVLGEDGIHRGGRFMPTGSPVYVRELDEFAVFQGKSIKGTSGEPVVKGWKK